MRIHLSIAAALLTACFASGQEKFEIFPELSGAGVSFTARTPIQTGAGEILQEVPASFFAGVGDDGASCKVTGFNVFQQDQNRATLETYNLVFRRNLPAGGPDSSAAGLILRSPDLFLPTNPLGGAAAYNTTITFATPLVVPCTGGISYGIEVRPATWPTDGQSMHMSVYAANPPTATAWDNTRIGLVSPLTSANQHAWYVSPPGGAAFRQLSSGPGSVGNVMKCAVLTPAAVLNLGNNDPASLKISYGAGGMYPAIKESLIPLRDDGLMARICDTPNLGGMAYVFLSIAPFGPPVPVPGVGGNLYLNLAGPVVSMGTAPILLVGTRGVATIAMMAPGTVPAVVVGRKLLFQAVSHDATLGNLRFGNAQAQSY